MIGAKFGVTVAAMLSVIVASSQVHASTTVGYGNVLQIYGTSNGAVLFSVVGTGVSRSGVPSCGSSQPNRWAIDASTVAGQAAVQVLLAAYAQHKPIFVQGTGTCTLWGDTETVDFFNLSDP